MLVIDWSVAAQFPSNQARSSRCTDRAAGDRSSKRRERADAPVCRDQARQRVRRIPQDRRSTHTKPFTRIAHPSALTHQPTSLISAEPRQVSDRLGLHYSDQGLNEVLKFGPGSSFDGAQFDGRGPEMKVLERFTSLEHDVLYRSLFEDRELTTLSERYFGFNPWVASSEGAQRGG